MIHRLTRAVAAELAARPILALTIASLGAQFVTAYIAENRRLRAVVDNTIRELGERASEIEERRARMYARENDAEYDPSRWGEGSEMVARIEG